MSVLRRGLPAAAAALSLAVIFVAVLSIPVNTAVDLGLSTDQAIAWIVALYGVPGVLGLVLSVRHRQPLLMTGNVFVLIFIASLGTEFSWPELVGASMTAGVVVLLLGPLGLTERLASWLPSPIVFGLLAGAVLPFVVDMFTAFGDEPAIVGGTMAVFLVARAALEPRIPAILPALIAGLLIAGLGGEFGSAPPDLHFSLPTLTAPEFSLDAILTVTPVMVVLITLQANIPSLVFLRDQGYEPPEGPLNVVSGAGAVVGSLLGPVGVSLSLPATALCAGPDAGPRAIRHWAAYIAAGVAIVIALLAGFAAALTTIAPRVLLVTVVGLAVVGVLTSALGKVGSGPLLLGPAFAFAVALSDVELLGLGPFFWALAMGLAVSFVVERDEWKSLRVGTPT